MSYWNSKNKNLPYIKSTQNHSELNSKRYNEIMDILYICNFIKHSKYLIESEDNIYFKEF